MAAAKKVILSGGTGQEYLLAGFRCRDHWCDTEFAGTILGKTAITLGNKASINGRLLAQTAVNLDATTVTQP